MISATRQPTLPLSVNQHSKWVLYTSLCLFAVGAVQVLFFGPLWFLWISVSVLAAAGVVGLLRLAVVPQFATPWAVLAVSLALGYGLGTFNTMASGYAEGMDLLAVSYAGHGTLSRTVGGILVLVGIMFAVGEIDPGKLMPKTPLTNSERRAVTLALIVAVLAAIVAVATGSLGFQSSMAAEEGSQRVSVLGALVFVILAPMLATAVFAHASERGFGTRIWVALLCLVLLVVLMLQGRRMFLYGLLITVMAFFAARGTKRFFTFKTLLLLALVGAAGVLVSKFYFALRMASWSVGQHSDLKTLMSTGMDIFMNASQEGLDDRLAENQSTRTFIIGYLSEIIDGVESHRFVGGGLLELGLATSVPTSIWPGKWAIMAQGSEEAICHPIVGLPSWDGANTILTAGMCDFGWYGFFMYPLVLAALFSGVVYLLRYVNPVVRLLVSFGIMYGLFGVETAISGYFVQVRNLVILGSMASVLVLLVQWVDRRISPSPHQPLSGPSAS